MDLHFRSFGSSGPPVVILHGLFGSGDNWMMPGKRLAENFRVFLPDQRNHGRSPWSDAFSYQQLAGDLFKFLDRHCPGEAVHLVGHSMGGKTGMTAALLDESRFLSLMVVDIAPRAYNTHHREIVDRMLELPLSLESRTAANTFLAETIAEESTRQFLLKSLEKDENGRFRWRINLEVIDRELEEVGKALFSDQTVHIPSLFVRGSRSRYISQEDIFEIKKQFVYSSVVTIENAGHWVQAEQPEAFYTIMNEWLTN